MRLRKLFCCCLTVLLCLILSAPAFAAEPIKVRTAWMDEHETFLIWYAKEKGWDKEVGLDIAMQTRKPLSTACWSGRTAPSPR